MKYLKPSIVYFLFIILSNILFSQENHISFDQKILTIEGEGVAFLGSGITESDAKIIAINLAKRDAMEKAGTYLESHTIVLNAQLVKDEIITFTGGLLQTEVKEEVRELVNNMFALKIIVDAKIDISKLKDRISNVRNNLDLILELEETRKRNKQLELKISAITKMNSTNIYLNNVPEEQEKMREINRKNVKDAVRIINSSDWYNKGMRTRENEKRIEYFTKAIELDPQFLKAFYERGRAYKGSRKDEEAIKDFNSVLKINPNYAFAYFRRATTYLSLNKYVLALNDYNKAIELGPNFPLFYRSRGRLFEKIKNFEKAIIDYNKAIKLDPLSQGGYFTRALYYIKFNKYQDALKDLDNAIKHSSKDEKSILYNCYINRAKIYYKLGNLEAALKDYEKVIEIKPDYFYLGRIDNILFKMGKYIEVIEKYNKMIELSPENLRLIERAYEEFNKTDKAIHYYNKEIEINPTALNYNWRGKYYSLRNKFENAISDYSSAIEIDSMQTNSLIERGKAKCKQALKNGDKIGFDGGFNDFERALKLNPKPEYYLDRAETYLLIGEKKYAAQDYIQYLKICNKHSPNIPKIKQKLKDWGFESRY